MAQDRTPRYAPSKTFIVRKGKFGRFITMTTFSYGYTAGRDEIQAFKAQWPCSGISDKLGSIHFQWDSKGDLLDVIARYRNGRVAPSETYDGPAIVAFCMDCQRKMHPEHAAARDHA